MILTCRSSSLLLYFSRAGVHATIKAVVLETHHWHITHRDNQQQLAIYIYIYILIVVSQSAAMSANWKFKLDARIIWCREGRVFV